jgi:WD40 repeat protein
LVSQQIWDAVDGNHIYTYSGHTKAVQAVAWSPDGARIAFATRKGVQILDATDGSHIYAYGGHKEQNDYRSFDDDDNVYTLAWSPDSTRIVSGARNGTAIIWQAV